MYPNLEMARQRELTLADLGWICGALIFLALMCFCVLFFVKAANGLTATQTTLLRTPAPVAIMQARPEPNPDARAQSAMAATPPGTQSGSSKSSSEVFNESVQQTLGRGATYKVETTDPKGAKVMLENRGNSDVRRFSSPRRVALDKRAPRSIKVLIEMWFRTLRTKHRR